MVELPEDPYTQEFWTERWRTGHTPFDQGGHHPHLFDLLEAARGFALPEKAVVLVPGCGRAHNAAVMAGMGMTVTALDIVPEAILAAQNEYSSVEGLSFVLGDALESRSDGQEGFDAIFDRAMLCALPHEMRKKFLRASAYSLGPGGLFLSLPFIQLKDGESRTLPPFQLGFAEMVSLFDRFFTLVWAEERSNHNPDSMILREGLCVWRRRESLP